MKQVKVGVIGCGNFARLQHLPNCQQAENVELYHCSSRSQKGRDLATSFGSKKVSADYKDVLNDPEVEMVILSVPHDMHMFYINETLKAGKNLFCEKPMVMTMEQAYDVIDLTRKNKVKLCVDYNRRFSPSMIDMKKAYWDSRKENEGKTTVYSQETNREKWAEEDQTVMMIRINDESLTYGGVHIDWKMGGGQIIGEGCHWLDLMSWMMEERPVRIYGMGSTRLNYTINVEFESGSIGVLIFSAVGTFQYPKELIEIQSGGKIFRSECFVENQYYGRGDKTVKLFPMQRVYFPDAGKQGGLSGYKDKIVATVEHFEKTGDYKIMSPDKGHQGLLEAFADAIANDKPSPIDEMAGMRATYLSLRAMDSIRTGRPLPINIEDWEMYVYQ